MNTIHEVVDRYFDVWNETDPEQRLELIASTWCEGARYVDPLLSGDDHQGINTMVAAVHQQFPGYRFQLAGPVDHHNGNLRFAWELVEPDGGSAVIEGIDFGVVGKDGRLRSITGFIDRAPEMGISG